MQVFITRCIEDEFLTFFTRYFISLFILLFRLFLFIYILGDYIIVDTKDEDWWHGITIASTNSNKNLSSEKGFFPGNYVEIVDINDSNHSSVINAALSKLSTNSSTKSPSAYNSNNNNKNALINPFDIDENEKEVDLLSAFDSITPPSSSLLSLQSNNIQSLQPIQAIQTIFTKNKNNLPLNISSLVTHRSSTITNAFICSITIGENTPLWRHPIFFDYFIYYKLLDIPYNSMKSQKEQVGSTPNNNDNTSNISPKFASSPAPNINSNISTPATNNNSSNKNNEIPNPNHAINKMSKSLRLICLALQKAREIIVNEDKNNSVNQILLLSIGIFNDASKLCEKLPTDTGMLMNEIYAYIHIHTFICIYICISIIHIHNERLQI